MHVIGSSLTQKADHICRSRWRQQANTFQLESASNLFDKFYLNGSASYETRASGNRINVWSLLYVPRGINRYLNAKWAMKHYLHFWN